LGKRQVTAIHTPGHTPGSVVYLVESDGKQVLFGQDVHGPLHDDFGSDRRAYRQSLINMAELGADILCEGHFGVFRGADKVKAFIRSFL
jgi:glyoxylase-like metal-dependent hydrolase (beta-lactamase superfamily II)